MARTIPKSIAPVVQQLELDGDDLVTVGRLIEVLELIGDNRSPHVTAYELQRAGWLGSLRTEGVWEFLPGSRGGRYGSGDRFIEFRAQLAVDPSWPGILAMESAASLLGLAQRIPEREVVSLPDDIQLPKALAGDWRRVSVTLPPDLLTQVSTLPCWNVEGLILGIAIRPSGYRDWAGLRQWLPGATVSPRVDLIIDALQGQSATVRQRAAYLLKVGGNTEASDEILQEFTPQGVSWLGQRKPGGHYDPDTKVNDTILHQFRTVGRGA